MKKEITIDGIRYVQAEEQKSELKEQMITETRGLVSETNTSCFEFSVIINNDGKADMPSVEYTDKRKPMNEWQQEIWDNEVWLIGLLEEEKESFGRLGDVNLSDRDENCFLALLKTAREKKML